jgi:hypothetical protein
VVLKGDNGPGDPQWARCTSRPVPARLGAKPTTIVLGDIRMSFIHSFLVATNLSAMLLAA